MIPGIVIVAITAAAFIEARNEIRYRAERFKCWLCRDQGCSLCKGDAK